METFDMHQLEPTKSPFFNSDCCLKICFIAAFVATVAIAVSAFVAVKFDKSFTRSANQMNDLGKKVVETIKQLPSIVNATYHNVKSKNGKDIIASSGSDFDFKTLFDVAKEVIRKSNVTLGKFNEKHHPWHDDVKYFFNKTEDESVQTNHHSR